MTERMEEGVRGAPGLAAEEMIREGVRSGDRSRPDPATGRPDRGGRQAAVNRHNLPPRLAGGATAGHNRGGTATAPTEPEVCPDDPVRTEELAARSPSPTTATIIPRVAARVGVLAAAHRRGPRWPGSAFPSFAEALKLFKPLGHTLLGVALGLLIVFRNNCSYDRYWEGRKLWGGIVNTSRNLVRGAAAFVGGAADLADLVAAYALALKQHLRGDKDLTEIQALVPPACSTTAVASAQPAARPGVPHEPVDRRPAGRRDDRLDHGAVAGGNVRGLLDNQGGCERILRTPIPFAYAVHIQQMLLLYLVTLPFMLAAEWAGWRSRRWR